MVATEAKKRRFTPEAGNFPDNRWTIMSISKVCWFMYHGTL